MRSAKLGQWALWVLVGLMLTLPAVTARGTGMMGHIYVSEQALDHVTIGELETLLRERKDLWENGSFLPDSGYAASNPYGEMAHWSQFVEGYIS